MWKVFGLEMYFKNELKMCLKCVQNVSENVLNPVVSVVECKPPTGLLPAPLSLPDQLRNFTDFSPSQR